MSQTQLAKKLGVRQSTVGMWENGTNKPLNASLEKIASFFGVSIDYLLGRTDEPNETEPEPQEGAPRTPEARIVSGWMDDLPQDVRKQIQTIVQAAIANSPELLRRKEDADAEHS